MLRLAPARVVPSAARDQPLAHVPSGLSPFPRVGPGDGAAARGGAVVLVGVLVLAAFGHALGAASRHQRVADVAAMSAAAMREACGRTEPQTISGLLRIT